MIGTGAFWRDLAKKIREARKHHADSLALGHFTGIEGARELVGKIAMLDWVLGEAAQLLGDNKHPTPTIDVEEDY